MNEQKHTPGPWRVVGPYVACDGEKVVAKYADNNQSVIAWAGTPADIEVIANGRLIAAAPELLEALEELEKECATHLRGSPFLDNARRAIAKARGQ